MHEEILSYIQQFNQHQQQRMIELYEVIKQCCPEAKEKISWSMPTFDYFGNLVHFAQHQKHLGFYPGESGVANFLDKLNALGFKHSKGAIQFPDTQALPIALIKDIVCMRIKENHEWMLKKNSKKRL